MKKTVFILSIVFLMIQISYTQIPPYSWGHGMGGQTFDVATNITTDSLGNVYVCGYFSDTVDFDPSSSVYELIPVGGSDAFVLKFNNNGEFDWAVGIGGSGNDQARAIDYSEDGTLYITGQFSGTVDFDPGVNNFDLIGAGSNDIFILKLSTQGDFNWAKGIGGANSDIGLSITTNQDTCYVTGFFRGIVDFDPNAGIFNLTNVGDNDVFILKLDGIGNFIWAKNVGSATADQGNGITIGNNNEVYITGFFQLTTDFDPGAGVTSLVSAGGQDIFILKLLHNGNFSWAKRMGDFNSDVGHGIKVDYLGNIYTVGKFYGNVDFNPDPALPAFFYLYEPGTDAFVQKLDPSGNFLWARKFGGQTSTIYLDEATSVDIDEFGDVYVAGYFTSTCNFDFVGTPMIINSQGGTDCFITKLNSAGDHQWSGSIGGIAADGATSIVLNKYGNIFTAGQFSGGIVDLDMSSIGVDTVRSNGNTDIFIQKLNQCFETPSLPIDNTPIANLTYCEYNTTTLSAIGNGTIYWYDSNTSSTILGVGNTFTPPSLPAGIYTYYAEDSICVSSNLRTPVVINVLGCLNVDENGSILINIYPNPFHNNINISSLEPNSKIMITDILGKVIYSFNSKSENEIVDLSELANGNYLLLIESQNLKITKKIIKN